MQCNWLAIPHLRNTGWEYSIEHHTHSHSLEARPIMYIRLALVGSRHIPENIPKAHPFQHVEACLWQPWWA